MLPPLYGTIHLEYGGFGMESHLVKYGDTAEIAATLNVQIAVFGDCVTD